MTDEYIPDEGHLIWLSLDPQRGREQSGRRPFVVLTPRAYNAKTSLLIGVPVTSARKGYPFEAPLARAGRISGVALADQIKSLDWRVRFADYAEDVSPATMRHIRTLLASLLALS